MNNVGRKWTIGAFVLAATIAASAADKPASVYTRGESSPATKLGTLSVLITPAGPVPLHATCTFTANVSGAVGVIHYSWAVNNSPIGFDYFQLSYQNNGPFRIQVFITDDANGAQANDSKIISTGGSSC